MRVTRTIIASSLMLLTALVLPFLSGSKAVSLQKPLSTFPKTIEDWQGHADHFDDQVLSKLGVDDYFLARYAAPEGRVVDLYVGYYESQRKGDLIHSPKNCLPGGGWNITETSSAKIKLAGENSSAIEVIKLSLRKGGEEQIVLYWFQSRGRYIASEYRQKIYLVIDSILSNRTDGSFVRLMAPVRNGNKIQALKDLKQFAALIIPILNEYLPSLK